MFMFWLADDQSEEAIEAINEHTRDWTDQAAKGECSWLCADCCASFPRGMPDECCHGHDHCTSLIRRDKRRVGILPSEEG